MFCPSPEYDVLAVRCWQQVRGMNMTLDRKAGAITAYSRPMSTISLLTNGIAGIFE